jgi:two-component system chemotaxis response regulator CheB
MQQSTAAPAAPVATLEYTGWLVVIGTSSGGKPALEKLLPALPADFPAAVLVVRHLAPSTSAAAMVDRLNKLCAMPCAVAEDGRVLETGKILFAPADTHLIVDGGQLAIVRGARVNRWRPSIDVLFGSAAVSQRNHVIGVLLSGYLDDGVAGLDAIKRAGGTTMVQDPAEAEHPDMPLNALDRVKVDHCLPLSELAELLGKITSQNPGLRNPPNSIPPDVAAEAQIVMRVAGGIEELNRWGKPSGLTCPECGGGLWSAPGEASLHYRCHTGHSFGPSSLSDMQSGKIEETLWQALRLFQERQRLLKKIGESRVGPSWETLDDQQREVNQYIMRLKEMLRID